MLTVAVISPEESALTRHGPAVVSVEVIVEACSLLSDGILITCMLWSKKQTTSNMDIALTYRRNDPSGSSYARP